MCFMGLYWVQRRRPPEVGELGSAVQQVSGPEQAAKLPSPSAVNGFGTPPRPHRTCPCRRPSPCPEAAVASAVAPAAGRPAAPAPALGCRPAAAARAHGCRPAAAVPPGSRCGICVRAWATPAAAWEGSRAGAAAGSRLCPALPDPHGPDSCCGSCTHMAIGAGYSSAGNVMSPNLSTAGHRTDLSRPIPVPVHRCCVPGLFRQLQTAALRFETSRQASKSSGIGFGAPEAPANALLSRPGLDRPYYTLKTISKHQKYLLNGAHPVLDPAHVRLLPA